MEAGGGRRRQEAKNRSLNPIFGLFIQQIGGRKEEKRERERKRERKRKRKRKEGIFMMNLSMCPDQIEAK